MAVSTAPRLARQMCGPCFFYRTAFGNVVGRGAGFRPRVGLAVLMFLFHAVIATVWDDLPAQEGRLEV